MSKINRKSLTLPGTAGGVSLTPGEQGSAFLEISMSRGQRSEVIVYILKICKITFSTSD